MSGKVRVFDSNFMPKFNYVALDARGQESVGVIEAGDSSDAVGQLRAAGYFPTSVVEEGKGKAVAKGAKSDADDFYASAGDID